MPLYRSILVAADFSDRSKDAFRMASSLASETKTRMFVLHVGALQTTIVPPLAFEEVGMVVPIPAEQPAYQKTLKERLRDEFAPSHAVDVEYLVRMGEPAQEILKAARELGNDLIAMGTHGRTGLRRLLAGSVAEAVMRHAPCPVMALSSGQAPSRVQVVLHPTDFSERAEPALRTARAVARERGAKLVLMHVMPMEIVAYGAVPVPLDVPAIRRRLVEMACSLDGSDLKFPVESRLSEGNAAADIIAQAQEIHADLIVLGTHGRSGLGRLLMGSVAEAVVRGAPCPVLAIKLPHPPAAPTRVESAHKHVLVF